MKIQNLFFLKNVVSNSVYYFFILQDKYGYSSKKCESKDTFTRPEYTPRPPPGGPTRDYTNFIILGVILLVIIIIVIVIVVIFCRSCMKPGATSRTKVCPCLY